MPSSALIHPHSDLRLTSPGPSSPTLQSCIHPLHLARPFCVVLDCSSALQWPIGSYGPWRFSSDPQAEKGRISRNRVPDGRRVIIWNGWCFDHFHDRDRDSLGMLMRVKRRCIFQALVRLHGLTIPVSAF